MDQLGTFLTAIGKRLYQEDSIDRLNYHYTVYLLLAFALTLSAKQYVGEPIQCWVPAEFTGGWEQYAESYCFIENTYFVRFDEDIPNDNGERNDREIAYYQWVPFILALEALMFYLPHMIWRLLNWQSGIYLRGIITMACEKTVGGDPKTAEEIAGHLKASLEMQEWSRKNSRDSVGSTVLQCGRSNGVYLTIVYLAVKVLFIINLILQFVILNEFLGTSYTFWGAKILHDILRNHDWQISGHFPRVTVCDFEVRKLGNLHRYTIQCVLMINMFSEKIFLFMWWWFLVVAIVTILNTIYWAVVLCFSYNRESYVQELLYGFDYPKKPVDGKNSRAFAKSVGPDVVLVLRLMANNAGQLMASRVCRALYAKKYDTEAEKDGSTGPKRGNSVPEYVKPVTLEKSRPVSNV